MIWCSHLDEGCYRVQGRVRPRPRPRPDAVRPRGRKKMSVLFGLPFGRDVIEAMPGQGRELGRTRGRDQILRGRGRGLKCCMSYKKHRVWSCERLRSNIKFINTKKLHPVCMAVTTVSVHYSKVNFNRIL